LAICTSGDTLFTSLNEINVHWLSYLEVGSVRNAHAIYAFFCSTQQQPANFKARFSLVKTKNKEKQHQTTLDPNETYAKQYIEL